MWIAHLRHDARYALRSFVRAPVFALTAIVSLAIGIGADTSVFTLADALLLEPPSGVTDPDSLVDISVSEGRSFGIDQVSFPNYLDLREQATTIADMYGYEPFAQAMSIAGTDGAERIFGHKVTTNYFDVLGVGAAAGRLFDSESSRQVDAEHTIVLGYRYWSEHYRRDPAIIGQQVRVNGSLFTIVGIAAEGFRGTSLVATDLWMPLETIATPTSYLAQRSFGWALLRGRLKAGISVSQAEAEIRTIGRRLEERYPDDNGGKGLQLAAASFIPGNLALPLTGIVALVLGFVSLVLVIACANLAGLLLARATARRREIAIRVAVGAGRARLLQQLLTETTLLFLFGAGLSLAVARWLTSLIVWLLPALPVPVDLVLDLDGRALVFTSAVGLVAAVVCGLLPALDTSTSDVLSAMKNGDTASGRSRLRHAFVVSQVALSIVLVAGTGVFARALQKASSINPGFQIAGIEIASVDLSLAGYSAASGQCLFRDLSARVRGLPGVDDASIAASLPTSGSARFGRLSHPGSSTQSGQALAADWNVVETQYFSTLRIPLLAGRDFTDSDTPDGAPVLIVSQEAARRYWPGQDPIGKTLSLRSSEIRRGDSGVATTLIVVGVVGNVTSRLQEMPRPQVYLPLQQRFVPQVSIVARPNGERATVGLRQAVQSMDPNLPVSSQTLEDAAAFALLPQRITAVVSGGLGLVGVLLAAMGIYGVTAYAVARRTREIGIRMAIGASRAAVIKMVVGVGGVLVLYGSVIGLVMALAIDAVLRTLFFGFPALDGVVVSGAAAFFALIAVVATYVPASRATAVDPSVVLRVE